MGLKGYGQAMGKSSRRFRRVHKFSLERVRTFPPFRPDRDEFFEFDGAPRFAIPKWASANGSLDMDGTTNARTDGGTDKRTNGQTPSLSVDARITKTTSPNHSIVFPSFLHPVLSTAFARTHARTHARTRTLTCMLTRTSRAREKVRPFI